MTQDIYMKFIVNYLSSDAQIVLSICRVPFIFLKQINLYFVGICWFNNHEWSYLIQQIITSEINKSRLNYSCKLWGLCKHKTPNNTGYQQLK